jgi:hypothetical protein
MKRTIAVAVSSLCAVALLAAAASPASAAAPPPGKGLVDFGTFTCEGLGDVTVIAPRGPKAAAGFTTTGQHIALISLEITGTDFDGNPADFSKTYGQKSALTAITCTQHFEEGQANLDITAVVGLVPPQ